MSEGSNARPIVALGAGNIVREAHIPAYRALGYRYAGFFDLDEEQATRSCALAGSGEVFDSLDDALTTDPSAIYDIAVPAPAIADLLRQIPRGSGVLIQKPLGRTLAEADELVAIATERELRAAVNFQLRTAPNMVAIFEAIERGEFGTLLELQVTIRLHTPWEHWTFLRGIPRMEVLYHSIHYVDLFRHLLGDLTLDSARLLGDPRLPDYAETRSSLSFVAPAHPHLRCRIETNHRHAFGDRDAISELRLEGTEGAAIARMGVNLAYPDGVADRLERSDGEGGWTDVPLRGSWFPTAFEGPMAALQAWVAGGPPAPTAVTDARETMRLLEEIYQTAAPPRGDA